MALLKDASSTVGTDKSLQTTVGKESEEGVDHAKYTIVIHSGDNSSGGDNNSSGDNNAAEEKKNPSL